MAPARARPPTLRLLAEIVLGITVAISVSAAIFITFADEEVTLDDGRTYECGSPGHETDWAAIRVAEERAGVAVVDASVADRCEAILDARRSTRTAALAWATAASLLLVLSTALRARSARRQLRERVEFGSDPRRRALAFALVRTIETERLIIRRPRPEDAPGLHAAIDRGVMEANGWTEEQVEELLRDVERNETTTDRLICERTTGRIVGLIDVGRLDLANHRCEVGFWLGPGARGWGYGTEALRAVLASLHDAGIVAVDVMAAEDNLGLQRIMQKLDAVEMARGPYTRPNGREIDAIWYLHRPASKTAGPAGWA